jgi:hypothetical protein
MTLAMARLATTVSECLVPLSPLHIPCGESGVLKPYHGRTSKVRPFFSKAATPHLRRCGFPRVAAMDENRDDFADRIGRTLSTIFIALLFALFAYAYLAHFLSG